MVTRTPNYNFELIDFDKIPWHEKEHDNWRIIDSAFTNFLSVTNLQGVWQNAIAVTVGQKFVDAELGTMWEVEVTHTSASTGTFAADRAVNTSYWSAFSTQAASKGAWETDTAYSPNDFVVDTGRHGIIQVAYTSGASYDIDVAAGNIETLVDVGAFEDVYLGSKTTNPTVDNHGDALIDGALYFNTTNNVFMVYDLGNVTWNGIGAGDLLAANNLSDVSSAATSFANIKQAATLTATGVIEIATGAETNTGSDATRAVSPDGLDDWTGSAQVTTLGTVVTGVWSGTDVAVAAGGTGSSTASAARTALGLAIGSEVQAYDADTLKADTADILTAGFAGTDYDLGTNTTGTETLDYTNGNFQYGVNGGAHTLAPQGTTSTIIVQYTNDSSAGALTTSGFTIVTGDSLDTVNGNDFMMYSTVLNSFKHLHVVALQ